MKKLLAEELLEERMLEKYRADIEGGFEHIAEKPEFRRAAVRAYVSHVSEWGLTPAKAARILSFEVTEYQRWIDEDYQLVGPDQLEKISCLLNIYSSLMTLYSGHKDRVDGWFTRRNEGTLFAGNPPYQLLECAEIGVFHAIRKELAAATV